jgi:2,3-bisphosphoglycerate-dependent phosphoglycerate mutase
MARLQASIIYGLIALMNRDLITRVLLLRHAETAAPHLFHGAESDIGLSERGRHQAEAIAPVLAAERPVAVVSSPMRRAVETAEPIARACGVELLIEPDLHERRIGALCGTPYNDQEGPWAETLRRWQAGETSFAPKGAESFDDVQDRVMPVWDRLANRFQCATYTVVAHGAAIKVILMNLDPSLSPWDAFRYPNLGITEAIKGLTGWGIARLGDFACT